ncbi:(d)CMP kinase [Candidatus Pelagibacter sp.]|uniref:(d)CMP kinase n=1 Tax=Candidatus Pelagibacter sp. TaxID=2024849 RepID=UPI003F86F762
MIKRKNIIKIAIDSPAAAGAGTLAKAISKHYNLLYVDTGKAYRVLALNKIKYPKKFNLSFARKIIAKLKIKDLDDKELLSNKIGTEASIIAKKKSIRSLVHKFQINFAYNPPKKYKGSCLDGRDITYNIVPDADLKFYITANVKTRAKRRFKELKVFNKKITYSEVLKSIKNRDKRDLNRKIAPLKKTKDSLLINTTNLNKRACFLKIKKIIDRKIYN